MTWRDLLRELIELTDEKLDQTCTIYLANTDEYLPITHVHTTIVDDVLDAGHFYVSCLY